MSQLRFARLLAAWFIWAVLVSVPASAQVARMSLDDLTSVATSIVHGRATESRAVWSADGKRIYTEVVLEVDDRLKGDGSERTVITIPGGQIGNVRYEVSDMPAMEEGEEVLAFVWRHPSGRNLIAGGTQGLLLVDRLSLAPEVTVGFELETRTGISEDDAATLKMRLEDLKQQVRKLIQ